MSVYWELHEMETESMFRIPEKKKSHGYTDFSSVFIMKHFVMIKLMRKWEDAKKRG